MELSREVRPALIKGWSKVSFLGLWFRKRPFISVILGLAVASPMVFVSISYHVSSSGQAFEVGAAEAPNAEAAIVLGAAINHDGTLSGMLQDRVDRAIQLYQENKVRKLLLSGDHARKSHDEVNAMGRYAASKGIPSEDIFLDHAGFTTFDTMYRARYIFKVNRAIVVTQQFHLDRAVYLARSMGIEAWGVESDLHSYGGEGYFQAREIPARFKAFVQVNVLHSRSEHLGRSLPITGDVEKATTVLFNPNPASWRSNWHKLRIIRKREE
ncbi:MAG TPA: ElyC/SanA/YdcF family protein [Blastocatellia bacterium]|nr:ElyC/SanA/YdcF family protein [Blastocatellia bacterium]